MNRHQISKLNVQEFKAKTYLYHQEKDLHGNLQKLEHRINFID